MKKKKNQPTLFQWARKTHFTEEVREEGRKTTQPRKMGDKTGIEKKKSQKRKI